MFFDVGLQRLILPTMMQLTGRTKMKASANNDNNIAISQSGGREYS